MAPRKDGEPELLAEEAQKRIWRSTKRNFAPGKNAADGVQNDQANQPRMRRSKLVPISHDTQLFVVNDR